MANKSKQSAKPKRSGSGKPLSDPWISMRSGMIIMAVISLGMAGLTAYTAAPAIGWPEAIFWGLVFGFGVWLVFGIFFYFNYFIRRKRS